MATYNKSPLSFDEQVKKLTSRGLIINDTEKAKKYLSNISYYRLRAYTYPFQDNSNEKNDHKFLRNDISFEDIIDLYCFDRRLRVLIFNAIEKIEVVLRTRIIHEYSIGTKNSHWFVDDQLYFDDDQYDLILDDIEEELKRSNEDFIKHYNNKYTSPSLPPAWMTLEVLSFGTLSRLYSSLKIKSSESLFIAKSLGLPNSKILINWMHAISVLRNHCAHHSRIWNRRIAVSIKCPYQTSNPFIPRDDLAKIHNNKLFAFLSCIKYLLNIISPDSDFKGNLLDIITQGGKLVQLKDMGFPEGWKNFGVWKS